MKKYLLLILFLSGCTETPPSVKEINIQANVPKELEDCKRYVIFPKEHTFLDKPEIVYRCPNSTTSTTVEVQQGKSTVKKTTIVIDGVEYEKKAK